MMSDSDILPGSAVSRSDAKYHGAAGLPESVNEALFLFITAGLGLVLNEPQPYSYCYYYYYYYFS